MCFEAGFTYPICDHTVILSRRCEKGTCNYTRKDLSLRINFCESCFWHVKVDPEKCLPLDSDQLVECKQFWDAPFSVGTCLKRQVSFHNKCNTFELRAQSDERNPNFTYDSHKIKTGLDLPAVKSEIEYRAAISQQGFMYRWYHEGIQHQNDFHATAMIHKAAMVGQIFHSLIDDILMEGLGGYLVSEVDEDVELPESEEGDPDSDVPSHSS
jgi:hypothetical protein